MEEEIRHLTDYKGCFVVSDDLSGGKQSKRNPEIDQFFTGNTHKDLED